MFSAPKDKKRPRVSDAKRKYRAFADVYTQARDLMRIYLPRLVAHLLIVVTLTALCSFPAYPISCATENGIESWALRGGDVRMLADLPGTCEFRYERTYIITIHKNPETLSHEHDYSTDYLSVNEITMQDVAYRLGRDKKGDHLDVSSMFLLQMTIRREDGGQLTEDEVSSLQDAISNSGYRSLSFAALSWTFLHALIIWVCCLLGWHAGKHILSTIRGQSVGNASV